MSEENDRTTVIQGWIDNLKAGDPAARGALLACARNRLLLLAHRMLRRFPVVAPHEQTDDVLNSAMLRLDRALCSITPDTAAEFLGLAATEIRRELMDLSRRYTGPAFRRVWGGDRNAIPDVEAPQNPSGVPDEVDWMAAWSEFHRNVGELPEAQRQLFDLLWYQDLSVREVASMLGVDKRTISRRWLAARERLCRKLGDQFPI
jgi:RNA polymerase sigma factor (sigma-70 family)